MVADVFDIPLGQNAQHDCVKCLSCCQSAWISARGPGETSDSVIHFPLIFLKKGGQAKTWTSVWGNPVSHFRLKTHTGVLIPASVLLPIDKLHHAPTEAKPPNRRTAIYQLDQLQIQVFGQGGPAEFWPQKRGGGWTQNLLKILGFPLKLPEIAWLKKKKHRGARGGLGPEGPPWIGQCRSHFLSH